MIWLSRLLLILLAVWLARLLTRSWLQPRRGSGAATRQSETQPTASRGFPAGEIRDAEFEEIDGEEEDRP
ncbi:MAG: hypothetical protein JW819_05355 [Candidatus Krumholzibacteriota bacterium]|nr:hypothetical protein [Candidatus Krumholzibacteriota bacterium]